MRKPPKVCENCERLDVSAVYMDGSAEYCCKFPPCEHRAEFKEAEMREIKMSEELIR